LGRRGQLVAIAIATLLRRRVIVSLRSVRVRIEVRGGRALNPTEDSLAEVDFDGLDLHIWHDIRILGILTCLAATVPSAQSSFCQLEEPFVVLYNPNTENYSLAVRPRRSHVFLEVVMEDHLGSRSRSCSSE
jgi:hypothetical protein